MIVYRMKISKFAGLEKFQTRRSEAYEFLGLTRTGTRILRAKGYKNEQSKLQGEV